MTSNLGLKSRVAAPFLAMAVCVSTSEAASNDPPEILVRLGQRVGCRVLSKKLPVTPVGTMHATYQARYGRAIPSGARDDASEGSPLSKDAW